MRKRLIILLFVIVLVSTSVFYIQNNPKVIVSHLIKKGEINTRELVYRVNLFGIIPVADAIFKIDSVEKFNDRRGYHLMAVVRPLRIYAKLFEGYGILDSFVDQETNNPLWFKQKMIIPGREVLNKEVLYDQENQCMILDGIKRQILTNTQDPLSAMFNLRYINFDKIKNFEMNLNTNQKNYLLKADAQQKELWINKKLYKVVIAKAGIKRRDKNPYHQSRVTMMLLNEKENIPFLIKVFANGFFINAKLVDTK